MKRIKPRNISADGEKGKSLKVALAGNPNVGKSTLFNRLTGMRQHTGNWTGKTVDIAVGECRYGNCHISFTDLPGTYSLNARSEEEMVARDYIESGESDLIAVVCDATSLGRNLILVLQIMEISENVVVIVNLLDEAKKKGIDIDIPQLSQILGVPVVGICARNGESVNDALEIIVNYKLSSRTDGALDNENGVVSLAADIARRVTKYKKEDTHVADRRIDRIVTGRVFGFAIMLLLLAVVLWLTIEGANIPSSLLSLGFSKLEELLIHFFDLLHAPSWLTGALIYGVFRTVSWVVSVMLPPMAIFFPLFTLLEDFGYLPRVAFNLDRCFKKCNACGKQALTM